jgi:hypothetical protein
VSRVLPLLFLLAGCRVERDAEAPPTRADAPAGAATPAHETAGPCVLVADDSLTILSRPEPSAGVFGSAARGDSIRVTATAAGGWLGFDPAVAQAANVGPFRLRWIAPDAPFTLSGACRTLPVIEAPDAGVCYLMAGASIALRAAPEAGAAVVDSLAAGGYAPVAGRRPDGWTRVRLPDGREAWAAPEDGSFNGPCEGE